MSDLFFYLKENGNNSFKDSPFSEVDSLILCQLSYLNLEKFINKDEVYLMDIIVENNFDVLISNTFSPKKNIKLLKCLKQYKRYRQVKISHIRNQLNYEECQQFYAVTYHIEDFIYICFRGTDLTMLGWKENFNMSYLKEIPSQRDSVKYVNEIFKTYHLKMYIGGHSKGGNLALYSALYSDSVVDEFIIKVYNFDGPGYNSDIYSSIEYVRLKDKIITMTTKEAIIGVLLYHVEDLIFINAKGFSILQHIPYNWSVAKDLSLKRIKKNSLSSRWFARSIRHFFEETNEFDRKRFVDLMFTIVEVSPEKSVNDFRYHPIRFIKELRKRYKTLSKEDRVFFRKTLKRFKKSFYHVFKLKFIEKKKSTINS